MLNALFWDIRRTISEKQLRRGRHCSPFTEYMADTISEKEMKVFAYCIEHLIELVKVQIGDPNRFIEKPNVSYQRYEWKLWYHNRPGEPFLKTALLQVGSFRFLLDMIRKWVFSYTITFLHSRSCVTFVILTRSNLSLP